MTDTAPSKLPQDYDNIWALDGCRFVLLKTTWWWYLSGKQKNQKNSSNLEPREKLSMECPLPIWKMLFAAILSSHVGYSEPKDFIRKSIFLVSDVSDNIS